MITDEKKRIIEMMKREAGFENKKSRVLSVIAEEIASLIAGGKNVPAIKRIIAKEIGVDVPEKSIYRWVEENGELLRELVEKRSSPKVVAFVNFKGGVGKSTLANIVSVGENPCVVNLDIGQEASKINTRSKPTYDFASAKEEGDVETPAEFLDYVAKLGHDVIILDTPGEVGEYLKVLDRVDLFVVPVNPGDRAADATEKTFHTLDAVLDAKTGGNRKEKWLVVLNRYDGGDELAELDEIAGRAKEILGDRKVYTADMRSSKAIRTMERKRKTPEELLSDNPVAYVALVERTKRFNEKLKEALYGSAS